MQSIQNFNNEQILPRAKALANIPANIVTGVALEVFGVARAAANMITFNQVSYVNGKNNPLRSGSGTLKKVYHNFLKVLNPKATFDLNSYGKQTNHYFTSKISKGNAFESRGWALLAIPSVIVARIADVAFAALALIPSAVLFGTSKTLNTWTASGLIAPRALVDVINYLGRVVSPEAKIV